MSAPWKFTPGAVTAFAPRIHLQGVRVTVLAQIPAGQDGNALWQKTPEQRCESEPLLRRVLLPSDKDRYVTVGMRRGHPWIRVVDRDRLEVPIAEVATKRDAAREAKKKPHRDAYQLRYAARKREENLRRQLFERLGINPNNPDFRKRVEERLAQDTADAAAQAPHPGRNKRIAHNTKLHADWCAAVKRCAQLIADSAAPAAPSVPAGPPAPPPERSTGS